MDFEETKAWIDTEIDEAQRFIDDHESTPPKDMTELFNLAVVIGRLESFKQLKAEINGEVYFDDDES